MKIFLLIFFVAMLGCAGREYIESPKLPEQINIPIYRCWPIPDALKDPPKKLCENKECFISIEDPRAVVGINAKYLRFVYDYIWELQIRESALRKLGCQNNH